MLTFLGLLTGFALTTSPSQELVSQPSDEVNASQPQDDARVVGGRPVKSCQWPSTLLLDAGSHTCTGTLVHPRIMITAAHCIKGRSFEVFSGDGMVGATKKTLKSRPVEYCKSHPNFQGTMKTPKLDLAYCKLRQPVKDIAPMPILMGCEVDYLRENNDLEVSVVGFGRRDPRDERKAGIKYEVNTKFLGISEGLASVGVSGKGPLQGDSGGPAYIRLPESKFKKDAGWRVFGITSTSRGAGSPDGRANYGMAHTFVEYLEKDSGIDVTPCTDAKGNWEPTEACKGAISDPYEASGDWINGCSPSKPGGYIASCGKPFKDEQEPEDKTAPTVEITSPKDGASFPEDTESIEVEVDVEDDGEIKEVVLKLDGKKQDALTKEPFKWELKELSAGEHTLVATATDAAGNEGKSESLKFEIKKEEEPEPTPSDDDTEKSEPEEDSKTPELTPSATPKSKEDTEASSEDTDASKNDGSEDPEGDEGDKGRDGGCAVSGASRIWDMLGLILLGSIRLRRRRS